MHTMITTYTGDTPQFVFTEMALAFLGSIQNGVDDACEAAANYANGHTDSVLDVIGGPYWGYANAVYEGKDMCPVRK